MPRPIVSVFDAILRTKGVVTLVGGGQASETDLRRALDIAPACVAVDGGAALALSSGVLPDAVIGDFDSLGPELKARIPSDRLHHIAEQDSTDFEKALTRVEAPVVIGVGFTGGRIDHQLGAFHTLMVCADRPCVLLGAEEIVLLAPPGITVSTDVQDVVSLFPLGPVRARSAGLHWPLDGLDFAPGVQSGTSNRATGAVTIETDRPAMLLILPRRFLRPVVASLGSPDCARWPARAG